MPRGGHRGGIYPVSGLPWGPGQRYLKRGLYIRQRRDIFVPRWGWRREAFNPSPLPDGSTKTWEADSDRAWPVQGVQRHLQMYARNAARYLQPALRCTYTPAAEYILEMLEPSAARGRIFSGIGCSGFEGLRPKETAGPSGVSSVSPPVPLTLLNALQQVEAEKGDTPVSLRRLPFLEQGRIRRLWSVAVEADIWRGWPWGARRQQQSAQQSPLAAAAASASAAAAAAVLELPLAECLYARSNHRLNSRRHPYWLHLRHLKDKSKIPYLHRRRVAREKMYEETIGALNA